MPLTDVIAKARDGQALEILAQMADVAPRDAAAVMTAVLPELSYAIERNTLSRGGLADLVGFMGQVPDRLLEKPDMLKSPVGRAAIEAQGIAALDLVLGSKDRSRAIADKAARATGVDAGVIRQMLPYLATMLLGGLAQQTKSSFTDIFKRHPQIDETRPMAAAGPFDGSWDGGQSPPPSGGAFPDQQPLPLPGQGPGGYGGGYSDSRSAPSSRTPYDDLSDILRRGGFGGGRAPSGPGGGGRSGAPLPMPGGGTMGGGSGSMMWNIVRSILGAALGFQSRGLLGWIIRAVVMRYGWQILQMVLRVMLGGGRR